MRSKYPLSSLELVVEFNELQEHLTRLLGYDADEYDQVLNVSGVYDTVRSEIEASGSIMIDRRLYDGNSPQYGQFYGVHAKKFLGRKYHE